MTSTSDRAVIDILRVRASEVGAVITGSADTELRVTLPIRRTSDAVVTFRLNVECHGGLLTVREVKPEHLPGFCPDRHINPGGSFCLYWKPVDGIDVDDAAAGMEWWSTVVAFLRLQLRAAKLRRWPNRRGRAHGEAARYQHAAEELATQLGLSDALLAGDLRLAKGVKGGYGRVLRLLRGDTKILAVWEEVPRVVTVRRACICGQHRRARAMNDCGDHASAAARLVIAMKQTQRLEADFMKVFASRQCCGTMDDCPLKKAA